MIRTSDPRERVTRLLASCYNDPDLFNTAILGRNPYFTYQKEICRSVIQNKSTIIYSGNAIGKDYLVGGLIPWFLLTRKDSMVVLTGPSQTSIGSITFRECRKAITNSRIPLGAKISDGIKSSPLTIKLSNTDSFCIAFSTTTIERAAGHHCKDLLCIISEASGLDDEIWEGIDSLKYTRLVAIGNPIRSFGRFIDLIKQSSKDKRDKIPPGEAINAIQIPSTMSPHAHLEHSPFGLADATFIRSMKRQHGENSLWFKTHIKAEIPLIAEETLFRDVFLDLCTTNQRAFPPFDPKAGVRRISADLSEGTGSGDDTTIWVRDDIGILECVHGNTIDLEGAAGTIATLSRKWKVDHANISYDCGGLGSKFVHYLAKHGIRTAREYLGSGAPMSPLYYNIRCEAAFNFRSRIDPGFAPDMDKPWQLQHPFVIPNMSWWPMLREELLILSYDQVGEGKTRLLKKELVKARLGRSPDYSDGFLQSWS